MALLEEPETAIVELDRLKIVAEAVSGLEVANKLDSLARPGDGVDVSPVLQFGPLILVDADESLPFDKLCVGMVELDIPEIKPVVPDEKELVGWLEATDVAGREAYRDLEPVAVMPDPGEDGKGLPPEIELRIECVTLELPDIVLCGAKFEPTAVVAVSTG